MPNLLSTLFRRKGEIERFTLDEYLRLRVEAVDNGWVFADFSSTTSVAGRPAEKIENSYTGYVSGVYKADAVVASCMRVRREVFRQARFCWRELNDNGPGRVFRDSGLELLEKPWPNGTTGELLTRMITDIDLCGNSYIVNEGDRLRWLRPDWVSIVLSGDPEKDPDVDVKGYIYSPGGNTDNGGIPYEPAEICHWAPQQDPMAQYRGMSWLTPAIREVQADLAATEHKLMFFRNGATLGPIVKVPAGMTSQQFKEFVQTAEEAHAGAANAYKTMYVGGGADVTLSAATMQQLEFKATQGAGETRIAALSGVHPVLVGLSEGLSGSSLNAGNFGAARRSTADICFWPLWQDACGALSAFVDPPEGAELWIRDREIPFLREDAKDQADITQTRMLTIEAGVRAGYKPDALVTFADTDDVTTLSGQHTNLFSVQLQAPGAGTDPNATQKPAAIRAQAYVGEPPPFDDADDEDVNLDDWDEETLALYVALEEVAGEVQRTHFNPALHPRNPKGSPGGGRFRSIVDRIVDALKAHADGDNADPLKDFNRRQLMDAAKARGITLRRGASEQEIKDLLLADVKKKPGHVDRPDVPEKPTPKKRAPRKATPKPGTVATPSADEGALSSGELLAIAEVSTKGRIAEGGWLRASDVSPAHREHLDALVDKGWMQKHTTAEGDFYRIDTRGLGVREPASSGALGGEVLPAQKAPDPRLSLTQVNRGAIIDGYMTKSGTFENVPETGNVDQSRVIRVIVQRLDPVDENGDPAKAIFQQTHRRIIGHDADTGLRVESGVVPAGSHWSWHANPSEDTSADIEGEIVPEKPAISAPPTKVPLSPAEILSSLPPDLTPAQKRARLRSRGVPKEQIDALVPLAARKKTAPKVDVPTAPAAAATPRRPSSPRLAAVQRRLDQIAAEAAPLADAQAKDLERKSVPTLDENLELYRKQARLSKLGEEGAAAAREMLDLLVQRDGEPWGGDASADAEQWRPAAAGRGTFHNLGTLEPDQFQKLRDRYVIPDSNTIIQNASLRTGNPTPSAETWGAQMSKMVRSSELARDTKFYRGAALRPDQIMDLRPGAVMHDRGIVSVGETQAEAEFYVNTRAERAPGTIKTMFEIRAPKGTPAVSVGYQEVVLDRDNRFRIISSKPDENGIVHVVMELVRD